MPYVITTKNQTRLRELEVAFKHAGGRGVELADQIDALRDPHGEAVATLEEARDVAMEALVALERRTFADAARATEAGQEISDITASGGKVGPLPDGTTIEIRKVESGELARALSEDMLRSKSDGWNDAEIIDAYNDIN